jgi:hypothetical protein
VVNIYPVSPASPATAPGMIGRPFHSARGVPEGRRRPVLVGALVATTGLGLGVAVGLLVEVAVAVAVGVSVGVGVYVGVAVGVYVDVGVGRGVWVDVGDGIAVNVGSRVAVGDGVSVSVGEGIGAAGVASTRGGGAVVAHELNDRMIRTKLVPKAESLKRNMAASLRRAELKPGRA